MAGLAVLTSFNPSPGISGFRTQKKSWAPTPTLLVSIPLQGLVASGRISADNGTGARGLVSIPLQGLVASGRRDEEKYNLGIGKFQSLSRD